MAGEVGLDAGELARFLKQREEMGGTELYFDELTRAEALDLAAGSAGGPAGGPTPAEAATTDTPGAASAHRSAPRVESGGQAKSGGSPPTPPASEGLVLPDTYEELRQAALVCERCRLSQGRSKVVFSDGNPAARLMVVGEAPGANEDRTGQAFVGQAGKLLDLLLASVGLSREETVYICNVIKCRPPGNRDPQTDEIEACSPYLLKQIELVAPEAILAVGSFSGRLLTGQNKALGKLRGQVHSYRGVPLVATYHPAALLRNPGWTRATWDDLQLLRQVIDGT